MKMTLESTAVTLAFEGTPVRVWEGTSEKGVPVVAYIALVMPVQGEGIDHAEFDASLESHKPPSPVAIAAVGQALAFVYERELRVAGATGPTGRKGS